MAWLKFDYALVIVLSISGILYFVEPNFKDLWVSLFATMITVLLIDRIIRKGEARRIKFTTDYVERRIADIFWILAESMAPPTGWKETVMEARPNWNDYYQRICSVSKKASEQLEAQLSMVGQFIEPDLMNDVTYILQLLTSPLLETICSTPPNERDAMNLYEISALSSNVLGKISVSMGRHKLARKLNPLIVGWKNGEPYSYLGNTGRGKNLESHINSFLQDSVEFRKATERLLEKQRKIS